MRLYIQWGSIPKALKNIRISTKAISFLSTQTSTSDRSDSIKKLQGNCGGSLSMNSVMELSPAFPFFLFFHFGNYKQISAYPRWQPCSSPSFPQKTSGRTLGKHMDQKSKTTATNSLTWQLHAVLIPALPAGAGQMSTSESLLKSGYHLCKNIIYHERFCWILKIRMAPGVVA